MTRRSRWTFRVVMLVAALSGGCNRTVVQTPLIDPVMPLADAAQAGVWYYSWVDQPDRASAGMVRDMLLVLGAHGREWRTPGGPDGYVLRVVLLDGQGHPVRAPGGFQAFAVHRPDLPEHQPLFAWSLTPQEANQRWQRGVIPGYVLQLDWGQQGPPPPGLIMVVVRWQDTAGNIRITRNVVFEDFIERGVWDVQGRP